MRELSKVFPEESHPFPRLSNQTDITYRRINLVFAIPRIDTARPTRYKTSNNREGKTFNGRAEESSGRPGRRDQRPARGDRAL